MKSVRIVRNSDNEHLLPLVCSNEEASGCVAFGVIDEVNGPGAEEVKDFIPILGEFTKIRARILTADGIDLTSEEDPTRRLIRQVLGSVSQFEKSVLVLKLRAARERKRALGERVEGRKPYGERAVERAVIDRMRELRRKPPRARPASFAVIARQLNAEGHRNRAGREWSAQMVHHVLATKISKR